MKAREYTEEEFEERIQRVSDSYHKKIKNVEERELVLIDQENKIREQMARNSNERISLAKQSAEAIQIEQLQQKNSEEFELKQKEFETFKKIAVEEITKKESELIKERQVLNNDQSEFLISKVLKNT